MQPLPVRGFTLIEVMIAVLVAAVGLLAAAGLQVRSLNDLARANACAQGATAALAWAEWLTGVIGHDDQDNIPYLGPHRLYRENFVSLARLDAHPADGRPVELEMPGSGRELAMAFNGELPLRTAAGARVALRLRKAGGGAPFAAADLPQPAPAGARMLWRIAAETPAAGTATIEILVCPAGAPARGRGASLRLVVAAQL